MRFDYCADVDGPQSFHDAAGRPILCKGGGGGADDGGAAAREAERQSRISAGTDAVNALFGVGNQPRQVATGRKIITGYKTADAAQNPLSSMPQTDEAGNPTMWAQQGQSMIQQGVGDPIYSDEYTTTADPSDAARQRQALYDSTRENTRSFYSKQLDEDRARAERDMRFHNARQGTFGSSQANDLGADFQRRSDTGLLDVANRADSAATQMRTADEQARLGLISKIVSGLDQGTAAQNAMSTLATNASQAKEAAQSGRMANVFSDLLGGYNNYQYGQGMQAARNAQPNAYGNFYPGDKPVSGTTSQS